MDNKSSDNENDDTKSLDNEVTYLVRSIFFGGGTPSSIDPDWIRKILDTVREFYNVAQDAEITMEMNPGTVTPKSLSIYKEAGINRISIGCQSLNDSELKELGRIHDSKTFYDTFYAARDAGFDNINVDLMSALPGQTVDSYRDSLNKIIALRPEHISAYSLIIEEGTPFYDKYKDVIDRDLYDIEDELVKEGVVNKTDIDTNINTNIDTNIKTDNSATDNMNVEISNYSDVDNDSVIANIDIKPLPSEADERQMYEDTIDILNKNGYHRYEVSNYARNDGDYECYHNKAYWKRAEYLGLGIGAAGMIDDVRSTNTDDINEYCNYWYDFDIHENEMDRPLLEHEELSKKACMEETMFLGLRMDEGVLVTAFEQKFGQSINEVYGSIIDDLCYKELIVIENDHIKLTEKGLELSNAVLSEFLLD